MSNIRDFIGGGSIRLAPDLSYPNRGSMGYSTVSGIDASAALTTVLSLTGAYLVDLLCFVNINGTEETTIKLTVDGVVIWNYDNTSSDTEVLLLGNRYDLTDATGVTGGTEITCRSSLLLQILTDSDSSVDLYYNAKAIL